MTVLFSIWEGLTLELFIVKDFIMYLNTTPRSIRHVLQRAEIFPEKLLSVAVPWLHLGSVIVGNLEFCHSQ